VNAWEAFLLGAVQGITEVLPVSSSGHLVLGQALLGIQADGIDFVIAVHVATLVSVLLVYRQRVRWLVIGAVRFERDAWGYLALLAVATVPAALVGAVLWDLVGHLFESLWMVGFGFVITAVVLASSRVPLGRPAGAKLNLRRACLIGCAQALAVAPGISRSGTTVVTALWLGVPAAEAAAFSFLLSVPVIAGAALLTVLPGDEGMAFGSEALVTMGVGGLAAAVFGVVAIRVFVRMLREGSFPRFAYYIGPVGVCVLLWSLLS